MKVKCKRQINGLNHVNKSQLWFKLSCRPKNELERIFLAGLEFWVGGQDFFLPFTFEITIYVLVTWFGPKSMFDYIYFSPIM